MKRLVTLATLIVVFLLLALPVAADEPTCATIQSGNIVYPEGHYLAGQPVSNGYDAYGFNYTAQRFSGWWVNAFLGFDGLPPYDGDVEGYLAAHPTAAEKEYWWAVGLRLDIKWIDAYRSRTDCDGNGWFDRHYGYETYMGSGAWYTNHVNGTMMGMEWRSFSKVAAVPADAILEGGIWYTAGGQEIGYAVSDAAPGMAGTMDVLAGYGPLFRGLPGLGRW
jgi:hypothetical protein